MNQLKKENQAVTETAPRRTVTPRYEVRETAEGYTLTAHVPGVDRASLETTVDASTLSVTGRRSTAIPEGWVAVYREIPQADFRLVIELDGRINREGVRAELNQGVLTLTLPKAETVKPRKIEISG